MRFFSGGRRAIWVEVATGAALLFGLTHYWHAHSAPRGRVNLGDAAIPTATVSPGNVADTIRISGTIGALRSATVLAPRIQGNRSGVNRGGSGGVLNNAGVMSGGMDFNLVLLRLAKPGARVKAGEIVAEFDPQNQVQRVDDYKDAVVQLDGSIRKMAANLASNKEAHDQQVRAAKAAWDKSIEDVKQASVVDAIDAELLRVAVQENEATYKQLVYESSLVDDQQISQIRLSQLNHDQADLELKRAEGNVTKMVIRAPMDGVVVMASIVRNGELGQVREGDQVNPGQPFMYIIDPTAMVLDASLNQVDAERLRLGAKALVHVDSYPDCEMPASVTGVGAMAQSSTFRANYVGEIPVRLAIGHLDPRVIPDLTGSADVILAAKDDALVLPLAAVFNDAGGPFVFLKTMEGWEKRGVKTGVASNTTVSVESGLKLGDVVALQRPM